MDRAYRILLDTAQTLNEHVKLPFVKIHQIISEKTDQSPDRTPVALNELSLILKDAVEIGLFGADEGFFWILPVFNSKWAHDLMKENDYRGLRFKDESVVVTWDYIPVSRYRDSDGTPAGWARSDGEVLQQCVLRTGESPRYTNHWSYRIGGVGQIALKSCPTPSDVLSNCKQYFPGVSWRVVQASNDLNLKYQEYSGSLGEAIIFELVIHFDGSVFSVASNRKELVRSRQSGLDALIAYEEVLRTGKDEWAKYCQTLANAIGLELGV